jgi:3-deoxy-D-manno-octulosonic-acid transferase
MVLYPVLTELIFRAARILAPSKSWLGTVGADTSWKQKDQIEGKVVWMHCASLGEFEMGKPILEGFLDNNPHWSGVVTFFSPSGYEPRKDYPRATVHYLPVDAPSEVSKWLKYCNPSLAVFVRYDLWPNHIAGLKKFNVPTVVIGMSAPKIPWYLTPMLPFIRSTFSSAVSIWGMVDDRDAATMSTAGIHSVVLGNPKYDYAATLLNIELPEKFERWSAAQEKPILVLGSAHEMDAMVLAQSNHSDYSVWLVPHDLKQASKLSDAFKGKVSSSATDEPHSTNILLIPEFGVLRSLYRLADAVIVGGGFGKATHNVLEATVQGKIVACGPHWQKIPENESLVAQGFLVPGTHHTDWTSYLERAYQGEFMHKETQARNWVLAHSGACDTMIETLEQAVEL